MQIEATVESRKVSMSSSKRRDRYTPHVTYSYTYNGTQYTSGNIRPGIGTKTSDARTAAEDSIDRYNVGETTTAYVVQGSPSKSYLKQKSSPLPVILGVLGLALTGGSGYKSVASSSRTARLG